MSSPRKEIGAFPKNLTKLFSESASLDAFVSEECKRRSIEHEPVSKIVVALKNEVEPDIDFPNELKFSVQPTLSSSKVAFKTLISGFPENISFIDQFSNNSVQYEGIKHHNPDNHPLHHFDYPFLVKEWLDFDKN